MMNASIRKRRPYRRLCRLAAALIVLALLAPSVAARLAAPPPAYAAGPIVVTTTRDSEEKDGDCSLREAIQAAVGDAPIFSDCPSGGGDPIIDLRRLRGTITLAGPPPIAAFLQALPPITSALPVINHSVQILGPGSSVLTITGDVNGDNKNNEGDTRVLQIASGSVRISGLTIADGRAQGANGADGVNGGGGGGGGAGLGGGMLITGGTVTLRDVRFIGNMAVGGNGGNGSVSDGDKGGSGGDGGNADFESVGGNSDLRSVGGSGGRPGAAGADGVLAGGGGGGFGSIGGKGFRDQLTGIQYGGNGGDANERIGEAGGGGSGLGGAIFILRGRLTLIDTIFEGNEAQAGADGIPRGTSGVPARALGGAVYSGRLGTFDNESISIVSATTDPNATTAPIFGTNLAEVNQRPCHAEKESPDYCGELTSIRNVPLVSISSGGIPGRINGAKSTGTFTISRTPPLSDKLTVHFKLSGTTTLAQSLTSSRDAQLSFASSTTGTLVMPAGTQSVTLRLTPRDDELAGNWLQIALDEDPDRNSAGYDPAYLLDDASKAALTIRNHQTAAWLALLYIAADDVPPPSGQPVMTLTKPALALINRLGNRTNNQPNQDVRVVVLFDGNQDGDTKLYVREPGDPGLEPLTHIANWAGFSEELDTGSPDTLRQFIHWARAEYPGSTKTMLSIVDHGGGWAPDFGDNIGQPGGQPSVQPGAGRGMSLDDKTQGSLSTRETHQALKDQGIDVLFFDACLMGMVESLYEVKDDAKYIVAGQNLLWAEFPYDRYLAPNMLNAATEPEQLAKSIVQHYNPKLENVENPGPYTIAAIDASKLGELRNPIDRLAGELQAQLNSSPKTFMRITAVYTGSQDTAHPRDPVQKFDYNANLKLDPTDGYVDLYDLADKMKAEFGPGTNIGNAAQAIMEQIGNFGDCPRANAYWYCEPKDAMVIALKRVNGVVDGAEWNFDRAHGLSIYLPIGEEDCRWTGIKEKEERHCRGDGPDTKGVPHLPMAERQMSYYAEANQLEFTRPHGPGSLSFIVPSWGRLLLELDKLAPHPSPHRTFSAPYPLKPSPSRQNIPAVVPPPTQELTISISQLISVVILVVMGMFLAWLLGRA